MELTARQSEILDTIRRYIAEEHRPPSPGQPAQTYAQFGATPTGIRTW